MVAPLCGSPQLIAALRVLHRLPVPRHPPCALGIFSSKGPGRASGPGKLFVNRPSPSPLAGRRPSFAIVISCESAPGGRPGAKIHAILSRPGAQRPRGLTKTRSCALCNFQGARACGMRAREGGALEAGCCLAGPQGGLPSTLLRQGCLRGDCLKSLERR